MKKILSLLFFSTFLILFSTFSPQIKAQSDSCADSVLKENDQSKFLIDAQSCLDDLIRAKNQSVTATAGVQKQIDGIKTRVVFIENDLVMKQKNIDNGYKNLAKLEEILNRTIRDFYIKSYYNSPIVIFLSASSASEITQLLAYQRAATDQDKMIITNISLSIQDLEIKKKNLKTEQADLAIVKDKLDEVVASAKAYQATLTSKISALSAKQQEILALKFNSAPVPKLAYTSLSGCSSDIGKNSGFGNAFGFFSFGVPNKVGLNQYGARGRAEAGQSYEDILKAYYDNFQIVDYDTSTSITINGKNPYGQQFDNESMNIEDYLKHLYEMPADWDSKALQAQAIAARSYAFYATNNGQNSIVPNENGQVVKKEENAQSWKDAVDATRGKVMTYEGKPIGAWYSSTHGGIILKSGEIGWSDKPWTKHSFDASSSSNIGDFKNSAYDESSPWFYCDWGYRKDYNSTAWLKEEEVVDIVNSYILWQLDNGTISHLSQTDQSIEDTWSADKVKEEIKNRGGSSISSISSIGVDWDGSGISRAINVNGRSFDAQRFKNMFNIRAPANIQIKPSCRPDSGLNCNSMYALYNVERQ